MMMMINEVEDNDVHDFDGDDGFFFFFFLFFLLLLVSIREMIHYVVITDQII